MSKRKYRPTSRICSLSDFENSKATWFEVRYGSQYRMWHRSALESLQVHTLICFIKSGGGIYACEKIENESSEVSCLLQHNRFYLALAERRETE